VTSNALAVLDPGQLLAATVLAVTICTRKTVVTMAGDLVEMVQRQVMTGQALVVVDRTDRFGIDPVGESLERCPGRVTRGAVIFDHLVSDRQPAGCKDLVVTASPLRPNPCGRHEHRQQCRPDQPAT
jgi:hypothetical protein